MDRVSAIVFDSAPVAMTSKAVWNASKAVMGARFAKQAIAFMKHMIEGDYEEHLAKRTDSVRSYPILLYLALSLLVISLYPSSFSLAIARILTIPDPMLPLSLPP